MSLCDALKVKKATSSVEGDSHVYEANVSEAWSIVGIPHGGYAVGIILSAVSDLQSNSLHPDPIHLTAHYLQPVDVSECEIRVKVVRRGRRYTNIDADLIQEKNTKISARIIYGALPDLTQVSTSAREDLTLTPSSPYGRRVPFSRHPSQMTPDSPNDKYLYQIKAEDRIFEERNATRAMRQLEVTRSSSEQEPVLDSGIEWGAWVELKHPQDKLELPMIPFFADCMKNLPSLLPRELRPGPSWFATVVLTVEFKSRIPNSISDSHSGDQQFSPRTAGIYSTSRFVESGRHDEFVEIWSAPSTIGSSVEIDPGWREKQVCLAISTQMAVTIPEMKSRRARL